MEYHISKAIIIISFAIGLSACSDTTGGQSNPIDSTNLSGVAPGKQVEGQPDTRIDTTIQARDQYRQDTLGDQAGRVIPEGRGTNTSNTSDARTTTGSANHGDADGDHKR